MAIRLSVAAAGVFAVALSASAVCAEVLDIPSRNQAPESPRAGWCGETAIQEALLYYGAYVPQREINRIGDSQHPDLYWSEMPRAMRRLGLRFQPSPRRASLSGFLEWSREHLRQRRPVLAGIKIYPTATPRWALDHMVLVVGFSRSGFAINTTWGRREQRSLAKLTAKSNGLSFYNRYGSYHAFAVEGLRRRSRRAQPTRLELIREGRRSIDGVVEAWNLRPGVRYQLLRYTGP
ncbi:MAG: C39 family peptidase, partial [Deltaproteobacteria bacterium]|nr:C39 family peptidase [Deltaproteobacteria bacterium]